MIAPALLAIGPLAAGTPIGWAETPPLADCSRHASHCLIRSSWEIVRLDGAGDGLDPALARGEEPDRSVLGRDLPPLDSWRDFNGSGWLVGNEAGDQVLQELSNGTSTENRNPVTSGRLEGNAAHWRGFARLEQVDHFSDATRSDRLAVLGTSGLSGDSPWSRRAWFGENLPPFSLAGGGIGWRGDQRRVEASYAGGWLWQNLPLSDRLVGWELRQGTLAAEWRPLRGEHTLRHLRRLGASGEVWTQVGRAGWSTFRDQLETGMDWRLEESSGPGGKAVSREASPWIRHAFSMDGWDWKGFHQAGLEGYLARDTVSRKGIVPTGPWRIAADLELTDQPDQLRPEIESSLLGRDLATSRAHSRRVGVVAGTEAPWGPAVVLLESAPWVRWSPRSFALDSVNEQGRFGTLRALEGSLWGWIQSLGVRIDGPRWTTDAGVRHLLQGGDPAPRLDFAPPRWMAHIEGQVEGATGLAGGARVSWQSRSWVRNLQPLPWEVPPRFTLDLWAVQHLEKWGLTGKAALLDLTASDHSDLPRGGQRRPRLLVGMDWQPASSKHPARTEIPR